MYIFKNILVYVENNLDLTNPSSIFIVILCYCIMMFPKKVFFSPSPMQLNDTKVWNMVEKKYRLGKFMQV